VRDVSPRRHEQDVSRGALVVIGGVALLASACGGSSGAGVAQVSSTTTGTDTSTGSSSDDPVGYWACMRSHGFPDFPDPESRPGGVVVLPVQPPGIDPDSPQVKAAQRACQKLLPDGGTPRVQQQGGVADDGEMRTVITLVLAGTLPAGTLLAAGCGGSAQGPGVATVGAGGTTTAAQSGTGSGLRYAACMRSHGVRNFPDPDRNGAIYIGPGVNTHSPTYLAAQRECLAKTGVGQLKARRQAVLQERMLRFASCMRAHGVPAFPDPVVSNGHLHVRLPNRQGLNVNSPLFRAAQAACQSRLDPRMVRKLVGGLALPPAKKAGGGGGK
jgi:hypothetical protein